MVLDIIFLLLLVMGFYLGFKQGLIHSIFSFVALFFGVMVAIKFSEGFSIYLAESFGWQGSYVPLVSFVLLFVAVVWFIRFLSYLLEKIAKTLFLGFINKALGAIFWCASLVLIYSTVLWYLFSMGLITEEASVESQTFEYIYPLAPTAINLMAQAIPFFEGMFESLEQILEQSQAPETTTI